MLTNQYLKIRKQNVTKKYTMQNILLKTILFTFETLQVQK